MHNEIKAQHQAKVDILSHAPELHRSWGKLVQRGDQINLGQLPQWYSIIQEAYGHSPLYLASEDDNGGYAVLPSFLFQSRLFGSVVTSMPFLDTGGPYSPSPALAQALVKSLIQEATTRGAHLVEIRCTAPMDLSASPVGDKVNLTLKLPNSPDQLWKQIDSKVRNQIRKAERSGLCIETGHAEKLQDFYEPFAHNMRDLGSPVHSLSFFQAIFKAFRSQARVMLVRKERQVIGGLIALEFKDSLIVPWASSLQEYLSLCPNMLLYWETLRSACIAGMASFDFGRSSRHSGTYRFKRQWGAMEEPLYWYVIPINPHHTSRLLSPMNRRGAMLASLWQHLPVGLTRWLGPKIRKHLTQ